MLSTVCKRFYSRQSTKLCLNEIRKQLLEFEGGAVTLSSADQQSDIRLISITHPQRKNAFTGSMCVSLYDIVQEISNDGKTKAVVVQGLGGMFCAGADLTMARQIADPVNGERFSYFMQTTLCNLRNLRIPSYAAVQGNVLGGGAEVLVACDFAMATPDTKINFVQGRMGIVPGWAAATHLVGKVGYHKALDLLLSSKFIHSDYAKSIGLINTILDSRDNDPQPLQDEVLTQRTVEIIDDQLGHLSVEVVHGLKNVTLNAQQLSYTESVGNERNVFKSLWGAEANMKSLNQYIKHKT